jgi:hypothetical protein
MLIFLVLVLATVAVLVFVLNNSTIGGFDAATSQGNTIAQQMMYQEEQSQLYCTHNTALCSSGLSSTLIQGNSSSQLSSIGSQYGSTNKFTTVNSPIGLITAYTYNSSTSNPQQNSFITGQVASALSTLNPLSSGNYQIITGTYDTGSQTLNGFSLPQGTGGLTFTQYEPIIIETPPAPAKGRPIPPVNVVSPVNMPTNNQANVPSANDTANNTSILALNLNAEITQPQYTPALAVGNNVFSVPRNSALLPTLSLTATDVRATDEFNVTFKAANTGANLQDGPYSGNSITINNTEYQNLESLITSVLYTMPSSFPVSDSITVTLSGDGLTRTGNITANLAQPNFSLVFPNGISVQNNGSAAYLPTPVLSETNVLSTDDSTITLSAGANSTLQYGSYYGQSINIPNIEYGNIASVISQVVYKTISTNSTDTINVSVNMDNEIRTASFAVAIIIPVCPVGYTGTYPSCTVIPTPVCPTGYTGTYPSCTLIPTVVNSQWEITVSTELGASGVGMNSTLYTNTFVLIEPNGSNACVPGTQYKNVGPTLVNGLTPAAYTALGGPNAWSLLANYINGLTLTCLPASTQPYAANTDYSSIPYLGSIEVTQVSPDPLIIIPIKNSAGSLVPNYYKLIDVTSWSGQ